MDWIDVLKSEVSQLWAEARHYYTLNEPLYLSSELEDAANQRQAEYTILNCRGVIMRE